MWALSRFLITFLNFLKNRHFLICLMKILTESASRRMINQVVQAHLTASFFHWPKALKKSILPIFLALSAHSTIDLFLNTKIELYLRSPQGVDQRIWIYAALSIFCGLFFPLLTTLFCAYGVMHSLREQTTLSHFKKPISLVSFLKQHIELSFLESLRAFGVSFLWGLLLIIPGIIKYSYYLLVPFVVIFSKKYHAGEVNALKLSETLSKKFWFKLNLYFALLFILNLILTSLFDQYLVFSQHPISASALTGVETVLVLFFHVLILKYFLHYLNEQEPSSEIETPLKEQSQTETSPLQGV